MNQLFTSLSSEETEKLAAEFAQKLKGGEIIALCGELGSGKTTFVRGLFSGLGGDPRYFVTSPTFTLLQEYPIKKGMLHHFDLYRLEKKEELLGIDIEDTLNKNGICVVEWGDKFFEEIPFNYQLTLKITGPKKREISVIKR